MKRSERVILVIESKKEFRQKSRNFFIVMYQRLPALTKCGQIQHKSRKCNIRYRKPEGAKGERMRDYITQRVLEEASYMVKNGATVRAAAIAFDISKSTVHKDVTERLFAIDPELYRRVQAVLEINLSERHLRGGNATKKKYEQKRLLQSKNDQSEIR